MNGLGAAPPIATGDAALVEKGLCGCLREAQPLRATAVKKVRILDRGDQGKAGLHSRRFGVIRNPSAGATQSGQSDEIDARKSSSRFPTGAADAESTARHFAVTIRESRPANNVSPPSPGHENTQRQSPSKTIARSRPRGCAEEAQSKYGPAMGVHAAGR